MPGSAEAFGELGKKAECTAWRTLCKKYSFFTISLAQPAENDPTLSGIGRHRIHPGTEDQRRSGLDKSGNFRQISIDTPVGVTCGFVD
ncbi:hypothetical protein OPQ81_004841 [Rhizoctonia solani]|nr:hypothetical protein OPQ81_004841 [Rhizoctonia solani]